MHAFPSFTWEEAVSEFLLHKQARFHNQNTPYYYKGLLGQLVKWANAKNVLLADFGKRHLDRYLVYREGKGLARLTLHHDAVCAKNFFAWCAKNDIMERNPLAEYHVQAAPKPHKHMPTDAEMQGLFQASKRYWDIDCNPDARYQPPARRAFHTAWRLSRTPPSAFR